MILYTVTVNSTGHTAYLSNGIFSKSQNLSAHEFPVSIWISAQVLNQTQVECKLSATGLLWTRIWAIQNFNHFSVRESLNFRTTPIQNSVYVTLWGDSRTSLLNFWLISHEINLSFKHSHFANVLIYHQGFSDIRLLLADCLTEDFLITRINLIEIFGIKLWWFIGTFRNLWQGD